MKPHEICPIDLSRWQPCHIMEQSIATDGDFCEYFGNFTIEKNLHILSIWWLP